nr:MAG TPA: hypothetical protein [Bacteriophage sp.]
MLFSFSAFLFSLKTLSLSATSFHNILLIDSLYTDIHEVVFFKDS